MIIVDVAVYIFTMLDWLIKADTGAEVEGTRFDRSSTLCQEVLPLSPSSPLRETNSHYCI